MSQANDKETNKVQLSIRIPEATNRKFQAKVKLAGSDNTEIVGRMIEAYIADVPAAVAIAEGRKMQGQSAIDGEFIKCPTQFREFINTMINRLMELSPDEIPEIRKLMIRFTEPGHIQQIIEEEERRTLRPRAVSNKK